jgi:hypothetical protein
MKKLDNKLFSKFELGKSELQGVVGGSYTSASNDSNAGGGRYDVCTETCVDGESVTDTHMCAPGSTIDKPVLTVAP